VFRADTVQILTTKEEALKNAALKDEDYFLVPKVIKK
jgi:Asp-tRNA(Asn)/Glu-tRNA(Gln) amidotransferase C subunit